jgi:hypothetical protein
MIRDPARALLGRRDIRARSGRDSASSAPRMLFAEALKIAESVRDDAKVNRIHLLWLTTPMQSYYKCAMNGSVTICGPVVTVLIEQEAACGNQVF